MKLKLIIIFLLIAHIYNAQSLFSECFIKKNMILIRWAPVNKELFDVAVKNGYKVTRSVLNGSGLSETVVLYEALKPYNGEDQKWEQVLKQNKNAALIYKVLYQNKNSKNIPAKEKVQQEDMLLGLALLSCDFDQELAKAAGLFLSDSLFDNNKSYSYKIEINDAGGDKKNTTAILKVDASKLSTNPKLKEPKAKYKHGVAKVIWDVSEFSEFYGGYNIERSEDSVNFQKINKASVILLSSQYEKNKKEIVYTDTVSKTKRKYFYRVRGINHFGELSEPSASVMCFTYPEIRSAVIIDSLKVVAHQKVFIQWKMENRNENDNVKAFFVFRSEKDNGPYEPIAGSNNRFSYVDENPKASNYYKIGAISFGNDTVFSFSRLVLISDTIPPQPPRELKASSDAKGNVVITWLPNSEKDLQGYKVFKANSLKEEFVPVSNSFITANEYKDKLNLKTLSKTIYYCIVATDNNFNNSVLSEPIEVKRPDTIVPIAPVIKDLQVVSNGIRVSWISSTSDDVKNYVLYRKEINKTEIKIKEWKRSDTLRSFTDTSAQLGIGYFYKVMVIDESDNSAVSGSPYIKFETGFRKKMTNVIFEVDRKDKFVKLKWNYSEKGAEKFIIYRASKKEPLTIVKTLTFPQQEFIDKTVSMGNNYEYRIKAVFSSGAESLISDAILVEY